MGADMYLNPPPGPPKDRSVVVNHHYEGGVIEVEVYGPYTVGRANTVRRKASNAPLKEGVANRAIMVRVMKEWVDG